jgi:hypothetical protein
MSRRRRERRQLERSRAKQAEKLAKQMALGTREDLENPIHERPTVRVVPVLLRWKIKLRYYLESMRGIRIPHEQIRKILALEIFSFISLFTIAMALLDHERFVGSIVVFCFACNVLCLSSVIWVFSVRKFYLKLLLAVAVFVGGIVLMSYLMGLVEQSKDKYYTKLISEFVRESKDAASKREKPIEADSNWNLGNSPMIIAGKPWNTAFEDLRVNLINLNDHDLEDIDLTLSVDMNIVEIMEQEPRCQEFRASVDAPLVRMELKSGGETVLPQMGDTIRGIWRITCSRFPSRDTMKLVVALSPTVPSTTQNPFPNNPWNARKRKPSIVKLEGHYEAHGEKFKLFYQWTYEDGGLGHLLR